MNPHRQLIAIAEACGWHVSLTHDYTLYGLREIGTLPQFETRCPAFTRDGAISDVQGLPAYLTDLNAMHEAEKVLPVGNQINGTVAYGNKLMRICGTHEACIRATAAQRAEAFLRTIGKWEGD